MVESIFFPKLRGLSLVQLDLRDHAICWSRGTGHLEGPASQKRESGSLRTIPEQDLGLLDIE